MRQIYEEKEHYKKLYKKCYHDLFLLRKFMKDTFQTNEVLY
jgi:hypothetical protein